MAAAADSRGLGTQRVAKDSIVYGAGFVLSRMASFILLPLYTRVLTPSDYGILQMLQITLDVVDIIAAGGLSAGIVRFSVMARDEAEGHRILTTAFWAIFGSRALAALGIALAAPWLSQLAFKTPEHADLVRLSALNFVAGSLAVVPMLDLQAQRQAKLYSIASVGKLVVQLSLNILFVLVFKFGVFGILMASFVAATGQGLPLLIRMLRRTGIRARWSEYMRLRTFGFAYQLSAVAAFILSFGDRFFLSASRTTAEVGLYGLAYQFGILLSRMTSEPFFRAWEPIVYKLEGLPPIERDRELNRNLLVITATMVLGASAMSLFSEPVLRVMSGRAFWSAYQLVPLIAFSYVIRAWGDFVRQGINISGKTKPVMYATWMGAIIAIALYWLLIPRLGGWGAAIATIVGFSGRTLMLQRASRRLWPVRWEFKRPLLVLALGLAFSAGAWIPWTSSLVGRAAIAVALFATLLAILWRSVLQETERSALLALTGKLAARLRLSPRKAAT